jgi:hypothetical protein
MQKQIAEIIADLEEHDGTSTPGDALINRGVVNALKSLDRNYISSVDACLELAQEYLPGWYIDHAGDNALGKIGELRVIGHTVEYANGRHRVQGDAPTKPVAYLLAILKAILIARQDYVSEIAGEFRADARVPDTTVDQVSSVLSVITAAAATPEMDIDEDDLGIVLRWLHGDGSFSLTFFGKGEVIGHLIHPGVNTGAWRYPVDDAHGLDRILNSEVVRDVICGRLGRAA